MTDPNGFLAQLVPQIGSWDGKRGRRGALRAPLPPAGCVRAFHLRNLGAAELIPGAAVAVMGSWGGHLSEENPMSKSMSLAVLAALAATATFTTPLMAQGGTPDARARAALKLLAPTTAVD